LTTDALAQASAAEAAELASSSADSQQLGKSLTSLL